MVAAINVPGDDFARALAKAGLKAGLKARIDALTAGTVVVYVGDLDRYVGELPDGQRFEVRLQPDTPRDSHICILRELPANNPAPCYYLDILLDIELLP
jgi:hypothetical protein